VEALQRLQPLDFLLVVVWAGLVGWGLQTGLVRQVGMLVGVYAAVVLAASLYQPFGQLGGMAFGREALPQFEFVGYVLIFVAVFGLVGVLIWRAYPRSRLSRSFGLDNLAGAAVGAVWGALLLIALVTILRFYTATPWRGQETTQQGVVAQVARSQLPPALELVLSPLWQLMTPWFPAIVPPRL
jgi:uncharacterized membrane protein required for colicin V production